MFWKEGRKSAFIQQHLTLKCEWKWKIPTARRIVQQQKQQMVGRNKM
jgi:hypothetical protein